jgi:hypothetical protein
MSDSGDKKRITINTDLFTTTPTKKNKTMKRSGEKKVKPIIKANTIKRELIKKIKQKQITQESHNNEIKLGIDENDFENEFMKSMQFLDTMIKEKKSTHQKKKSMKKQKTNIGINTAQMHINTHAPSSSVQAPARSVQAPTRSVQAPTRSVQAPTRSVQAPSSSVQAPASSVQAPSSSVQAPTRSVQAPSSSVVIVAPNNAPNNAPKTTFTPMPSNSTSVSLLAPDPNYGCLRNGSKPCFREYHNKTMKKNKSTKRKVKKNLFKKRKYIVGKTAKNRTISVLIKNNQTRRRVQQDLTDLKRKPLSEIKKELYKKNLLKIGSICPPDVIRTLYENAMLAGHITNTGKGVSIHNFINEDD